MSFVARGIPTVGLLLQGLLYVTTPRFMPYHADALGTTWEALPSNYQGFLIGVIKAMVAGSIGATLALIVLLLIPFRLGDRWARWTVPLIGTVFTLLTAYAAFTIDRRTPASPPWRQTCGLTALDLITSPWIGDLDGMVERRRLRLLTPYSKTHYFIDRGVQRGVVYDFGTKLEKEINRVPKTRPATVSNIYMYCVAYSLAVMSSRPRD